MNIYSIYKNSSAENDNLVIIKQGFSITACLFNILWSLYNKMWIVAFFAIIINYLISSINTEPFSFLANAIVMFLFGFFATDLQEFYANNTNMTISDIILARSKEEAEIKYMERNHVL